MTVDGLKRVPGLTLRAVLDAMRLHSPAQVFVLDRDGVFVYNAQRPDRVGSSVFESFPASETAPIREALAGKSVAWRANYAGLVLRMAAEPLREEGEICGVLGLATDISAQTATEEKLEHVFHSNMMAMLMWSDEGVVTTANEAFLALSGHTLDDVASGALTTDCLRTPEFADRDGVAWEEIVRDGRCTPYEKLLVTKDGMRVPVLVGASRFDRTKRGGVGFVLDRREHKREEAQRQQLQTQLLQVQKLESLGILAGGIAHDFNNLLTAIMGGASTALLSLNEESPARLDVEHVLAASRRAADLTRQMLAYSGKGHFDVRLVDLSAAVREIATLLETTIPKKIQLRLELAAGLPPVKADVAQLQQVIMNLVINGAEAIGEATGTVLVTTGTQALDTRAHQANVEPFEVEPGTYVYLEVHDSGCGMDDATKAKIFDPFFTTKFTGRGLGLAAVQGIVRGHKGAIRVYSTPGRGTTFKLLLPAAAGVVAAREQRTRDFEGSGLALVIDDDATVRTTAARMLTSFGFSVVEAENGREGVDVLQQRLGEVRFVMLDMTMPVMSGEEAFREIRALAPELRVLLMSGYNEIEATRRFTAKGLAGFLQKPFTVGDLAEKLKTVLA